MAERKVTKEVTDSSVKFKFATGEEVEVKPSDFPKEIQRALMLNGISQKLGDSYAGEDADKCYPIFNAVLDALKEGKWSRSGGGGGGARVSQIVEALARAAGVSVEEAIQKYATLSDEEKKGVRALPAVKKALNEIKLEKIQKELEASGDVEPIQL